MIRPSVRGTLPEAIDVITNRTARRLHDAGLPWTPSEGDRFVLPGRGMDADVFTIAAMVVEVRDAPAGRLIAFNGTTEWALDAVEQAEAIWLPREEQLREALGSAMLSLVRAEDGWRCTVRVDRRLVEVAAAEADEAYAEALLQVLQADG
ncbi:pilus assembly protein CpaE [Egicoccus sp. AB-alg6-2]|uniref:pilus assembly protein CpaE n=1 Tax=Egicoccus sp. AB-alg6-2 TaxID=3242692 RepID=UPI00359EA976